MIVLNPFVLPRAYASALPILNLVGHDAADIGGRELQKLFMEDDFNPQAVAILSSRTDCTSNLQPIDLDSYGGVLVSSSCLARVPENSRFVDSAGRIVPNARIDNRESMIQLVEALTLSAGSAPAVAQISSNPLGYRLLLGASANPRVLNLATMYYPGWTAKFQSTTRKTALSNGAINGFIVPAGPQMEVDVQFFPDSFRVGLAITVFTAVLLLLTHVIGAYVRGQRMKVETPDS